MILGGIWRRCCGLFVGPRAEITKGKRFVAAVIGGCGCSICKVNKLLQNNAKQ